MIRPDVLDSERPYGPTGSRGCDIWNAMCAAGAGDVAALRGLLESDPSLPRAEYWYTPPLYFAVREGHLDAARILLDAGADPAPALLGDDLVTVARDRGHDAIAGLLEEFQARRTRAKPVREIHPIHAAAEKGDVAAVRALLAADPQLVHSIGGDGGTALHAAARAGDRPLVELLLAHGADPNAAIDSSGSATYAARTPDLRALLVAHGGRLDPYDLVWLGDDDEVVRRVAADPPSANAGCGGALAAACTLGKRGLLVRLLEAGVRVPSVVTACRSYLLADPDMLRLLLASGMNPDLPNWQGATPLHDLCGRDGRGRSRPHRAECAAILLDAGAALSARDEDYRSTPLGWAARNDLPDMVELLLARGAPTNLPDDERWATPLAWAMRRRHGGIAQILRAAGATA